MTMAMASAWGMTRQLGGGNGDWSNATHAAIAAGLKIVYSIVETNNDEASTQTNIQILDQLVNGLGLFDASSPSQQLTDQISKAKKLVANLKK